MRADETASPCPRPGCSGDIDETGFCLLCGRAAPGGAVSAARRGRGARPWWRESTATTYAVAGLARLPAIEAPDPVERSGGAAPHPNIRRTCGVDGCQGRLVVPVYGDQEPLFRGFCPRCGAPFSFLPHLDGTTVLGGQYQVVHYLAQGGLGWVYLAEDLRLDRNRVVAKGLLNTHDPRALENATNERQHLTALSHEHIVRIFNAVPHHDAYLEQHTGYIIMEFVNGPTLREVADAARGTDRLPLEHILGFGSVILSALDYLHGQGLLYCDMKPDNVIWGTQGKIKIIDLGAVRRVDDRESPVIGTRGYQVPDDEIREHGPTVRSDLFTVARTLNDLFDASVDAAMAGSSPVWMAVESFRRLVNRATAAYDQRFPDAQQMSRQLAGVLREAVALRTYQRRTEESTIFEASAELVDGGLAEIPPVERWTRRLPVDVAAAPTAETVACRLPEPRPAADDPAAAFLTDLRAPDPASLLDRLRQDHDSVPVGSVEVELCQCRAYLRLHDPDRAKLHLAAASEILGTVAASLDWRVSWHAALIDLATGRPREARAGFDAVYAALPGEVAPKLALGLCHELLGERDDADQFLKTVWWRDTHQASAAFGLARLQLRAADRTRAVAILDEVPPTSRYFDAARVAAVRALFETLPGGRRPTADQRPTAEQLTEAASRLPGLHLDGGAPDGDGRRRLTAALQEAALDHLLGGGPPPGVAAAAVLGRPVTETGLRSLLDTSYREIARQAGSADDHGVLVDRANTVRPQTLLTGWRR